jgi:pimeloyl-ACP methyl ester carboxylesterase
MLEQFLYSVGFAHSGQSVRQLPQWQAWLPFRQSLRSTPYAIAHKDDIKRLRSFNKPVLLVKGIGSANFLHQIIDTLFEYLPNAKLTEMPAGHAPHIVSMDRFLNELQEFQSA